MISRWKRKCVVNWERRNNPKFSASLDVEAVGRSGFLLEDGVKRQTLKPTNSDNTTELKAEVRECISLIKSYEPDLASIHNWSKQLYFHVLKWSI